MLGICPYLHGRLLCQSICLTTSDLNSSSKPWWIQERTSKVVYEEFHEQVSSRRFSLLELPFYDFTCKSSYKTIAHFCTFGRKMTKVSFAIAFGCFEFAESIKLMLVASAQIFGVNLQTVGYKYISTIEL